MLLIQKQWLVKSEILEQLKFTSEELSSIYEKQNKIFEEYELKRKKEIQENQQKNEVILNEHRLNYTGADNSLNNISGSNIMFNLNNIVPLNYTNKTSSAEINLTSEFDLTNQNMKVYNSEPTVGQSAEETTKIKKPREGGKSKVKKNKPETKEKEKKIISSSKKKLAASSNSKKIKDYIKSPEQISSGEVQYFDLSKITFNKVDINKES